jgi:1,3-beta-glucan synthase component
MRYCARLHAFGPPSQWHSNGGHACALVLICVNALQLPGDPVVGEGKPENQNHAIIFTRGEMLQAIDMNQEGYYEEALKMRNLLQEFLGVSWSAAVTV